jgi:hypothetical protein
MKNHQITLTSLMIFVNQRTVSQISKDVPTVVNYLLTVVYVFFLIWPK